MYIFPHPFRPIPSPSLCHPVPPFLLKPFLPFPSSPSLRLPVFPLTCVSPCLSILYSPSLLSCPPVSSFLLFSPSLIYFLSSLFLSPVVFRPNSDLPFPSGHISAPSFFCNPPPPAPFRPRLGLPFSSDPPSSNSFHLCFPFASFLSTPFPPSGVLLGARAHNKSLAYDTLVRP